MRDYRFQALKLFFTVQLLYRFITLIFYFYTGQMFQIQLSPQQTKYIDISQLSLPSTLTHQINEVPYKTIVTFMPIETSPSRNYNSDQRNLSPLQTQSNSFVKMNNNSLFSQTDSVYKEGQSRIRTRKIFQKKVIKPNYLDENFKIMIGGPIQVTCRNNYNHRSNLFAHTSQSSNQISSFPKRRYLVDQSNNQYNSTCYNGHPQDNQLLKHQSLKTTAFSQQQQPLTINKNHQYFELDVSVLSIDQAGKQNQILKQRKYITFKKIDNFNRNKILEDGIMADFEDPRQNKLEILSIVSSTDSYSFKQKEQIQQNNKNKWVSGACVISLIIIIILLIYS